MCDVSQPKKYRWISNNTDTQAKLTSSENGKNVSETNWYPICPYIRFAQYDVVMPSRYKAMDMFIRPRVIFDYELMFVKSGHAVVRIEDKTYEVQPNDLILFKPKQRHSIELIGDETFIQPHIHFDLIAQEDSPDVFISFKRLEEMSMQEMSLFRPDITDEFISPFPNFIRLNNPYLIEHCIFDIVRLYESKQPFSQIAIQGLFLQLWYQLLIEIQGSKKGLQKKRALIDEIKLYLEQNTNRMITMDELASRFYINKHYISRLFQKNYNMSPIQYHTELRIHQAVKLLELTNLSVMEIAGRIGYSSSERFGKAFKKLMGTTPSAYRKDRINSMENEQ